MKTNEEYTHLLHTDKPKEVKRSGNIRGISASYMVFDEGLLTPEQAQVILRRVGDHTPVIFAGDMLTVRNGET